MIRFPNHDYDEFIKRNWHTAQAFIRSNMLTLKINVTTRVDMLKVNNY